MSGTDDLPEDDLHAWVDGRLAPDRAAQVSRWLQDHPEDAARVAAWQAQRSGLRGLHAELLDAPVPAALTQGLRAPEPTRWATWQALAAALLLAVGFGAGWSARPWSIAMPLASGAAPVPAFVRDAAVAYAVYTPERRHPVEVGADQQEHLLQWLSKRLDAPLRAPRFDAQGYALVGGRLLPGSDGSSRAQFMYESAGGERLTLYVSTTVPANDGTSVNPTVAFSESSEGETRSFYWVEGRKGYALSGKLPRAALAALSEEAYAQLQR